MVIIHGITTRQRAAIVPEMRLVLALPPEFLVTDLGEGQYTAVAAASTPQLAQPAQAAQILGPVALSLYCSAIMPQPGDPAAWCEQCMLDELSAEAALVIKSRSDHSTVVGWHVHLIEGEIVSAADGSPQAVRLGAFYVFLEYVAYVMVRAESQAQLDQHRQEIMTVLLSGRADWSGPIVALSQLGPEDQDGWSPRATAARPPGVPEY